MSITFGYWGVKGRAEYIRWMMKHMNIQYNEVNPTSMQDWAQTRSTMSTTNPLVNLPFIKDESDGRVVSECPAIIMDLCIRTGRKEMLGQGGADILFHRNLQEMLSPIKEFALSLLNGKTKADLDLIWKDELKQKVTLKLYAIDKFTQPRSDFLLDYLTAVDFELAYIAEIFDFITAQTGLESPFENFKNLHDIKEKVMILPGVRSYVDGSEYENRPFAPPGACKFTGHQHSQGQTRTR